MPVTSFIQSASGVFSPADLSPEIWLDPSDISTLWKDTAGTSQVTADGDAVARIDDKSGNGHHATQATLANRPLYKTSGGLHWLQFDGTNDGMKIADAAGYKTTVVTVGLACSVASNLAAMVGYPNNVTHTSPWFRWGIFKGSATVIDLRIDSNSGTKAVSLGTAVNVISYVGGGKRHFRLNAVEVVNETGLSNITYPNAVGLHIGFNSSGTEATQMNMYSLVLEAGESALADRQDLEEWQADKSGVTL